MLIMVQDLPKDLVKSMGDRAILYLDVDGEEPVISAVHPDGTVDKGLVRSRDVGCFLCSGSSSGVWAPDGSQFAFVALDVAADQSVLYLQTLKGERQEILRFDGQVSHPAWSPDGQTIALLGDDIHVVDLASKSATVYSLRAVMEQAQGNWAMSWPNKFRWSPAGPGVGSSKR